MKHIIDTDELEKLIKGKIDLYDSQMEGADYDDFIRNEWAAGAMRQLLKDLRALIASSPQADGMVLTSEMISAGAVPINNWNNRNRKNKTPISPMERVIAHQVFDAMKAAYKPQADDVRKDAELKLGDIVNPSKSCCEKYSEWKPDEQMKIVAMAYKRSYSRVISDEIEYTTIELSNPDSSMTDGWKADDIVLAPPAIDKARE